MSTPHASNPHPPTSLLLTEVTVPDGTIADVLIEHGQITAVTPHAATTAARAEARLNLGGFLLLPAPAEPHAHLDKVLTSGLLPNDTGDLSGAIDAWYSYRTTVSVNDIVERATTAALTMLEHGSTAVRTHVDVGTQTGLRLLQAMVEVRERLRGRLDLDIVAFVDVPVSGADGADNRTMLREAITHGADVVGGAPYRDPNPVRCQEHLLDIAAHYAAPVDLHTDETLNPSISCLGHLATHVRRTRFPHRVTASHCVSLGVQPAALVSRVAAEIAAAGIAVICCPATNLYLQGRGHQQPIPRGITALRPLLAAGVTVAGGGDNIQDPFNPLGRGDPLDTAGLLVLVGHLTIEEAYAAISNHARVAMGLPEIHIAPGFPAEILAIRARCLRQAIAERSAQRVVVHRGQIVSHTNLISGNRAPTTAHAPQFPITP